jgi:peptidoglycan/LPS O-acetylase OafA/YrhL
MFFYFIFSISLIFNKNISVILTSVVLLIFALIGFYIKDDLSLLKFWTDNIIIEFGYGLVIGYLYLKFGSFTSRFFIPLLLLSLLILFTMPQLNLYRFISSGVPAALLVTVFVFFTSDFKGQIVEQTALMLGDSSYSLYLCHLFVLAIVKIIFPFSHNFPSFNWLYVIVSTVLSVICSIVIYQFIEKNTINYLNNMLCKWYV